MNNIFSFIKKTGMAMLATMAVIPINAQTSLPKDALPMILVPHEQTIGSTERIFNIQVNANIPYEITENADWLTIHKNADGSIYVHATQNFDEEPRQADITFSSAEKKISQVLTITQKEDGTIAFIPTESTLTPDNAYDNGHTDEQHTITMTLDKDPKTYFKSKTKPSASAPVVLTYDFNEECNIDYIDCSPLNNKKDGSFGEVDLYVKYAGDKDFKLYGEYNFNCINYTYTINLNEAIKNPASIQLRVKSCYGNNAVCSEMRFRSKAEHHKDFGVFADDVCSKLKEGVTEEDIINMTNPFLKSLAYKMYKGLYSTDYRLADYECFLHYRSLAELWNAPGKHYDQIAGVTGMSFPAKSKQAILVKNIPNNIEVELKVIAWYIGRIGSSLSDGIHPRVTTYKLHNGLNVINYDYEWEGLAYICYYAQEKPELYKDITVHFLNADVNGYLTQDKTNDELYEMCANAKNKHMDVVSKKVHAIWTAKGLKDYCRAQDGSKGYRQYMNILDSLLAWEHRSLGLEKYNRIPKNRTMAYVNYTYYMFQGGLGVSFHVDVEPTLLNCKDVIEKQSKVWGMSHEWGHQHQMHPYFCWGGMSEVSNNVQSYYNVCKMGERNRNWSKDRDIFLNDSKHKSGTTASELRKNIYAVRDRYAYSPKMYQLCEEMKDGIIAAVAQNKHKAVSYAEESPNLLCSLIMPFVYFTTHGVPDFAPDWYEALRQNDDPNGSQVEKKGPADKYELIASAQNNNKNGKLTELRNRFPESCWIKDNYITDEHHGANENAVPYIINYIRKVSRLSGYNLAPFYEKWGYLRQIAMMPGDYSKKYYIMTKEMYDEFMADMDALVKSGEIKPLTDQMLHDINYCKNWEPAPSKFPN